MPGLRQSLQSKSFQAFQECHDRLGDTFGRKTYAGVLVHDERPRNLQDLLSARTFFRLRLTSYRSLASSPTRSSACTEVWGMGGEILRKTAWNTSMCRL